MHGIDLAWTGGSVAATRSQPLLDRSGLPGGDVLLPQNATE